MPSQNFQQYFRALRVLFFALLAGQILICIVLWFNQSIGTETHVFQEDMWLQGIAFFSLILVGAGLLLRKKGIESARSKDTLKAKLAQYRASNILIWALIEGPTLINAVFFFLSGKIEFLYTAGATIALFATQIPVRDKLINELELSAQELKTIEDPHAEVMDLP